MKTCKACGKAIVRNPNWSHALYERRIYCDRKCQAADRPTVEKSYEVVASGCWEWRGHVDRNGYGKVYDPSLPVGRRMDWAHRVSYRKRVGEIPHRRELDHMCENTLCINPEHLQPLTKAQHAAITLKRSGHLELNLAAAQLRQTGMTYAEIAEAVGLAGKEGAHSRIQSAIRQGLVDPDSLPDTRHLDKAEYPEICTLYALGVPQLEIAAWYGVDGSQISRIVNGKRSHDNDAQRAQERRVA